MAAAGEQDRMLARGPGEHDPLLAPEPLKAAALVTVAFACVSGLLLGYDIGITNGVLHPIRSHFDLSHRGQELFAGFLNLWSTFGCFVASYFCEWFGRRGAIAIGALSFLIGNLLMTFAMSFEELIIGRGFAGFAVGITLVTEPLYTAETSPALLRGMLSTNVEVSFNIGILLGFSASWALGGLPDAISWRYMLGICLIAPILSLLGVIFVLPESPRWLASRGRHSEAEAALHWLLGPEEAARTARLLRDHAEAAPAEPVLTWRQFWTCAETRWLVGLGGGVTFFSQATGIESIMYYSSVILERAGFTRNHMLLGMVVLGVFKLLGILVQGALVDSYGRRPMLLTSSIGMAASMMVLGAIFGLSPNSMLAYLPLLTFIVFFSLGFGPLPYTLNAELYPNSSRAKGLTVAMVLGRGVSALVSLTFLSLAHVLTYPGAFIFYGTWGILAAAFVYLLVPETAGKPLERAMQDTKYT